MAGKLLLYGGIYCPRLIFILKIPPDLLFQVINVLPSIIIAGPKPPLEIALFLDRLKREL